MNLNDILKRLSGRNDVALYDNSAYVEQWQEWYIGKVRKFHNYKVYNGMNEIRCERYSLGMAKKVCEDWANLLINEKTDITLSSPTAQEQLNKILEDCRFWRKANDGIEKTFALGTGAFVVSVENVLSTENGDILTGADERVKVSFVNAENIYPLTYEDGDITECAFVITGSKKTIISAHLRDENGIYKIYNCKCMGDSIDNLTWIDDDYYVFDTKSQIPWFYVMRPNIANNIEINSPLGISVFANAIDILKEIDLIFDSFATEFALGKKRIFINARQSHIDLKTGEQKETFDTNDILFYVLPESDDGSTLLQDNTQTLRVTEHQTGIQSMLNLLSYACGFGTNHYKFDGGSIATATQIVSENSDLFRNLKKHEIIIEEALKTVVRAVIYASNTFTANKIQNDGTIEIKFDDSIIEDKQGEMANDRLDVSMGVMSKAEFRAKWYNEDLETAQKKIDEMDTMSIADDEPYADTDTNETGTEEENNNA